MRKAWNARSNRMTKDEMKDEMKNKISMALKDPILQIGFELICKNLAELKKENAELKKQLEMSNKVYNDNLDYSYHIEGQLTKAKGIIKDMLSILPKDNIEGVYEITEEAEQFLNEARAMEEQND